MNKDNRDFKERLKRRIYDFVLKTLRLLETLPHNASTTNIFDQLRRSSSRILGNFIEAQYSYSRKEFASYLQVSLRSTKESIMWICLLRDLNKIAKSQSEELIKELDEFSKIFTSSLKTIKRKKEII